MSISDRDYLVLSNIAYLNYNNANIDPNNPPKIEILINNGTIKSNSKWYSYIGDIKDWRIISYKNNNGLFKSGFVGWAFKSPIQEIVFAFRGTEYTTFEDIWTDIQIAVADCEDVPNQFKDAKKFVCDTLMSIYGIATQPDKTNLIDLVRKSSVSFTGHSLGGGLAQYLVYETHDADTRAVTFNAVGIGQVLPCKNLYKEYRVKDYVDVCDIIGNYGKQLGQTIYLKNKLTENNCCDKFIPIYPMVYLNKLGKHIGYRNQSINHIIIHVLKYLYSIIVSHGTGNFLDDFDSNGCLIIDNISSESDVDFLTNIVQSIADSIGRVKETRVVGWLEDLYDPSCITFEKRSDKLFPAEDKVENVDGMRDINYINTNQMKVPKNVELLPNIMGDGNVCSLHQAIARDKSGELKELIISFINENSVSVRNQLFQKILFKWTDSNGIEHKSRGTTIDARKLAVLESFFGGAFVGVNGNNPNAQEAKYLKQTYWELRERLYGVLMIQTHLKSIYSLIIYKWDKSKQTIIADLTAVRDAIQVKINEQPDNGKMLLEEFLRVLRAYKIEDIANESMGTIPFDSFEVSGDGSF